MIQFSFRLNYYSFSIPGFFNFTWTAHMGAIIHLWCNEVCRWVQNFEKRDVEAAADTAGVAVLPVPDSPPPPSWWAAHIRIPTSEDVRLVPDLGKQLFLSPALSIPSLSMCVQQHHPSLPIPLSHPLLMPAQHCCLPGPSCYAPDWAAGCRCTGSWVFGGQ